MGSPSSTGERGGMLPLRDRDRERASLGALDPFSRDGFREGTFGVSVAFGGVRFGSFW